MKVKTLWLGIDIGSTTVKSAIVDPQSHKLLHSRYVRHNAKQTSLTAELLEEARTLFPEYDFRVVFCGSGSSGLVKAAGALFVQEVVANAIAVREFHPETSVAIELGGQDAKVVFFSRDERTGKILASDMRMNGACAGGTGAFIDQMAELLAVTPDEFGLLAMKGRSVYEISGRCGVFAKTDIQPLLNQGIPKEDIALSSFHAIAKQTIGGLAQGMEIRPPVIFEGGPLRFNPMLVEVFRERLGLTAENGIVPDFPEILVAYGAALSVGTMFSEISDAFEFGKAVHALSNFGSGPDPAGESRERPFFADMREREEFTTRHPPESFDAKNPGKGETVEAWLGIDSGSTTSKFVLLDSSGALIDRFYSSNDGDPLRIMRKGLIEIRDKYRRAGALLKILGVGTTGYGELLVAEAWKADFHTVETIAHAEAALRITPDVSFILDIGGQDMKAISVRKEIVTGIILNEACSSGCGSFLETYSRSLGIPIAEVAERAFAAKKPSRLGSRCTVFMNSSIITEQKNGKSADDILAGLCGSIIENVFTKVIRAPDTAIFGNSILAQGGTFKNDAVLRALEQYTKAKVLRPPHPGEMGAIGIALLTAKHCGEKKISSSSFIGLDALDDFDFRKTSGIVCPYCTNSCNRTVIRFNDGSEFITGNRCEKGEILGDAKSESIRTRLKETQEKLDSISDLLRIREKRVFSPWEGVSLKGSSGIRIGIPRVLEFWHSGPFWSAFFGSLGFELVYSDRSSYPLFEEGLSFVPSDTVCFPAKLAHGHVENLMRKKVDFIFMPMMIQIPKEIPSARSVHACAVVQGYPLVVDESDEPLRRSGIPLLRPMFHWYDKPIRNRRLIEWVRSEFGLGTKDTLLAIENADMAMDACDREQREAGMRILSSLSTPEEFAVVLAGRPYHADPLVNHGLSVQFARLGIPVLLPEALPGLDRVDLSLVRADTVNTFHARMYASAIYCAQHPHLEIAQIVSFGCGHDAVISDEMTRLVETISGKSMLIIKLDEGEVRGPMALRVKSFVETMRARRKREGLLESKPLPNPYPVKFTKSDKAFKTIFVPNLSETFSRFATAALKGEGYMAVSLPLAGPLAIELGKKYVHNDICFPAQINVGEFLAEMRKGGRNPADCVCGLAKNCDDCRAGQYAVLARKALDQAGYSEVPIFTTSAVPNELHPGIKISLIFQIKMLWGIAIADALEAIRLRIRPYEKKKGRTDAVFEAAVSRISAALEMGTAKAFACFKKAVEDLNRVELKREARKPRVFVIGEVLLNYHPSSNGEIVRYLEANGLEVMLPRMVDFFQRDLLRIGEESKRRQIAHPFLNGFIADVTNRVYDSVVAKVRKASKAFAYFEHARSVQELAENVSGLIDKTYIAGEGWLIPSEIIEHAREGVENFIIVQPFGCLPNHITGRGLVKTVKRLFPHIRVLSLDFDPDTSVANIENRLQMLIIAAKESECERKKVS